MRRHASLILELLRASPAWMWAMLWLGEEYPHCRSLQLQRLMLQVGSNASLCQFVGRGAREELTSVYSPRERPRVSFTGTTKLVDRSLKTQGPGTERVHRLRVRGQKHIILTLRNKASSLGLRRSCIDDLLSLCAYRKSSGSSWSTMADRQS